MSTAGAGTPATSSSSSTAGRGQQQQQQQQALHRPRPNFGDTTLTKVFVGGLPWETRDDQLHQYFQQFGEILEAVVIFDRATSRSRGYGFVTFRDAESAMRSVENANPIIGGRQANCNIASQRRRPNQDASPQERTPPTPLPAFRLPPPQMYVNMNPAAAMSSVYYPGFWQYQTELGFQQIRQMHPQLYQQQLGRVFSSSSDHSTTFSSFLVLPQFNMGYFCNSRQLHTINKMQEPLSQPRQAQTMVVAGKETHEVELPQRRTLT